MANNSFEDIIKQENMYINARRQGIVLNTASDESPENSVGIAFSGGGIRSATFGLGVLQALKEKGLLKQIDYLSTVSGGGYIGSWLSANCKRTADRIENQKQQQAFNPQQKIETDWLDKNACWEKSINHLRRYSNYLSPNLSLLSADTWSMATIWLRNTLLFQTMIIMTIACLLLAPRLVEPSIDLGSNGLLGIVTFVLFVYLTIWIARNLKFIKEDKDDERNPLIQFIPSVQASQKEVQIHVVLLMLVSLGFSALLWNYAEPNRLFSDSITYLFTSSNAFRWFLFLPYIALLLLAICSSRNHQNSFLVALPASMVLYFLLATILYLLGHWKSETGGSFLTFTYVPPLVLSAFALSINILIGMQSRDSYESVREWWGRFGAWLAICSVVWMVVVVIAFYAPFWSAMLYENGPWKTLGTGWLGTTLAGLLAGKSSVTGKNADEKTSTKLKELIAKITPIIFIAGLFIIVATIIHVTLGNFSNANFDLLQTIYGKQLADTKYNIIWCVFIICLFSVLLFNWRIDINVFSLNAFYRNRLARCYLGATRFGKDGELDERHPHQFTGFDDNDDLKMSDLVNTLSAPLHIVNCALNLGGSSDLALHTRHSANFTITPFSSGSHYEVKKSNGSVAYSIGYHETRTYGGKINAPTLGQAISVSGAAASPNMGYHTSTPVAFLMTLFNARLGWWFPNPSKSDCLRPSPRHSLLYLIEELFGFANEKSEFLAISDGGHFENLAAYELVKRKCKVIIISDGECDPHLQFEGLGTLIRMCQVDLKATIDITVSPIHHKDEFGRSLLCYSVGTITYHDGSQGTLIYIKASLNRFNEDDTTAIMQYKSTHPDFPHETTGDQFYSEDQFESYRRLGHHITQQLFNLNYETDIVRLAENLKREVTDDINRLVQKENDTSDAINKLKGLLKS